MERIPSRRMTVDTEEMRELLNSTLGEKLEAMRGVAKADKAKPRGQKVINKYKMPHI